MQVGVDRTLGNNSANCEKRQDSSSISRVNTLLPWAKHGLPPVSMNKVSLEYSHAYWHLVNGCFYRTRQSWAAGPVAAGSLAHLLSRKSLKVAVLHLVSNNYSWWGNIWTIRLLSIRKRNPQKTKTNKQTNMGLGCPLGITYLFCLLFEKE